MPYLKPEDKGHVEDIFVKGGQGLLGLGMKLKTPGELNYTITRLIQGYAEANGGRYQQYNDVLGALEGAKLEFYRRKVAPYEDQKILENGDVT